MYAYRADGSSVQIQIFLNVYDLNPSMNGGCYNLGLGFYHSGIQIGSNQFTFGQHESSSTGVMEVTPKVNHPNFRESISLGKSDLSYKKICSIIDGLKQKFAGNSYHIIRKNCNTFTNCVSEAILHKKIPGFVNRMANLGKGMIEISDFFMLKPYNQKYEVSAKALGFQAERSAFQKSKGVAIG